jgi:undecaprenyl-diphosphatase
MPLWQVLILAVVQGITEFLPISSDGHLVLVANLLNEHSDKLDVSSVVIALHMGTLASIVVFYWKRLWALLSEDRRVIPLLLIGTIPAVLFGLALKSSDWTEKNILENPLLAGLMLPVTGLLCILAARCPQGDAQYRQLSWKNALLIGLAQATAILPGLSRSGSTISSGLGLKLTRESAATFSFLLAVPVIAGAGVFEALKVMLKGDLRPSASPIDLVLGAILSFFVGLAALWFLVRMLERGKFSYFGWYCIVVGILVTIWRLSLLGTNAG